MIERKSMVAHIHECEENRSKGKRKKKEYGRVEMEAVNTELLKEKMKEI